MNRFFLPALLCFSVLAAAQTPSQVLPDRPDSTATKAPGEALSGTFESLAAGIAFRAPAGWKESRSSRGSQIVQFTHEPRHWTLTVNRLSFNPPVEMTYHKVKNDDGKGEHDVNGLFEETIDRLKTDSPGIQIDRQEITQMNGMEVGLVAARARIATEDNITMIALIRQMPADTSRSKASSIYYTFNLNAPVERGAKLEENADVHQLVDTFNQVLESVRFLDQSDIRHDQEERLYRARTLQLNLTESRLREALLPEQWLRLMRNGKDVGYMYIVEEVGRDLPRPGRSAQQGTGPEGVLVGVRSRTVGGAADQIDVASWSWTAFDRRTERWTSITAVRGAEATETFTEIGSTQTQIKLMKDDRLAPGEQTKSGFDKGQPPLRQVEVTSLDVFFKGKQHASAPISQELVPWYLPQAALQLLPRLVAKSPPKSYMFAGYNADARAVMNRYVDVDAEQLVELGGTQVRAIPVRDRWGLEGSVTTHYVSKDGKYLGSVNPDSKITVLATDHATLEKIWQNANISRPKEVEDK